MMRRVTDNIARRVPPTGLSAEPPARWARREGR